MTAENMLRCIVRLFSLSVLCAAITFAAGCENHGKPGNHFGIEGLADRVLRRGLPGEPRTLDPQLVDDYFSYEVVWDLYEGLTALDREGNVTPGVASSWSTNPSGTVYTFQLRSDAKWSDGQKIDADEFVAGLRRAVNPATASPSATLLSTIKNATEVIDGKEVVSRLGVSAPDANTVRIELERPAPYILQILAEPVAAPFHRTTEPDERTSKRQLVTDGPYVLADRVPNSFIELSKNPNYWNAGQVAITRVKYLNAESEATELHQYLAGQLDVTYSVPTPDLPRVSQEFKDQLQTAPILGTLYLALNVTQGPLSNRDLRRALSMAVDRDEIAEHLVPNAVPAYAFVARGIQGYESPAYEWAVWPRDKRLAYARTLYNRAGFSAAHPLHLRLYFNSGESNRRVMLAVAGAWKQNLGVESALTSDEFRVFLSNRKDKTRWDAARIGWDADYNDPSNFLDNLSSASDQNDPGYDNSAYNDLLKSARQDSDVAERMQTLKASERILLDDYPIIPLYFYTAARLVKPYVGGVHISPLRRTYSRHLFWVANSEER